MDLLKRLCECSGIPGQEGRLRELVAEELDPICDEARVDGLGNLIYRKAASKAKDTTIAADIPRGPEHELVTRLGDGVAIKLMDSGSISHAGLVRHSKSLAARRKIEFQMEILPRGGTDAAAMQRIRSGVPVVTLSIPTRYFHTSVELVDKRDVHPVLLQHIETFLAVGSFVYLTQRQACDFQRFDNHRPHD